MAGSPVCPACHTPVSEPGPDPVPVLPATDNEPGLPRRLAQVRWPVVFRRALVAGHTVVTLWLLWTHQVTLGLPWVGPTIAAACTLIALFISATAIRGKWWPWLWAFAGWVAPATALSSGSMWPVYLAVLVLPSAALYAAKKKEIPLEVRLWLFRDFHPVQAVQAALHHDTTFTLYRHFDASGRLLYVGKTNRPAWKRTNEHAKDKNWFAQVTTTTYTRYATEDELSREEIAAIRRERPLHNVQHNRR